MSAEERLKELGIVLPEPFSRPGAPAFPFRWVRVRGDRAYVAGHVPMSPDGSIPMHLAGKVGRELTVEAAAGAARMAALGMLGSLRRELGSLDRISAWLRVFGMVNAAPGFTNLPPVVNGFSELILSVFGDDVGGHSRSAVGMAELPFGMPVEVEAEVEITP
jgi:enamine deaminase RidA (YjgF/YER057c/UK114 family)